MPYLHDEGRYKHEFEQLPPFKIEKNLLTFAAARSGKGATQIIPWLLANTHTNALVIDPKGEALEATLQTRQSYRAVYALDPFNTTNNTQSAKATLNVLDFIDPTANSAFREINALADGLVMRHDAKGAHWDGGGVEILAGFIAHVLTFPKYENNRSLVTVRQLLTLQIDDFNAVIDEMVNNDSCGNLAGVAAAKINNSGNEANHFISVAVSNTKWIDDPDIAACISSSSFDLSDIKKTPLDVFLILPVEALGDYGRFLRLFVRVALYYMQIKINNNELKGQEVYFILDEAFSIGYISEIENSMSAMPGFNLRMWTFWQDLNQLIKRYDPKGAGTFFANSDAAYFFGVNDPDTGEYVSRAAGVITEYEIGVKPPNKPITDIPEELFDDVEPTIIETLFANHIQTKKLKKGLSKEHVEFANAYSSLVPDPMSRALLDHKKANEEAVYSDKYNEYQHARNVIGRPRISSDQVQQITRRNAERGICDNALVLREGVCYIEPLNAYFEEQQPEQQPEQQQANKIKEKKEEDPFADWHRRRKQYLEHCEREGLVQHSLSNWKQYRLNHKGAKWVFKQKLDRQEDDYVWVDCHHKKICSDCGGDVYLFSANRPKGKYNLSPHKLLEFEYCAKEKNFSVVNKRPINDIKRAIERVNKWQ